ncbi:carboxylesterase type B [Catenibacillus scindens]|uniref:Carboxylic ester hydrolase n=1 Tax=Catenibacillus scindens TaxID=673271 RepID=A0A7W8HBF9_9FIRM|nr:carboxylesterase family protein [Catenibacillus scindens]MBB5264918.1 carboxylesterase type B [Catenibacillus scindens]
MSEKIYAVTDCGVVMGDCDGAYVSFKGIPYARAQRFCPPAPVKWEGVQECLSFGKQAMQVYDIAAPWAKHQNRDAFDEDCLSLNIYIPEKFTARTKKGAIDVDHSQKLPVLLEVHGGAFQTGSSQEHTPEQMIRDNRFIYVAVNYRLGVWGFLYLGDILGQSFEASGNSGLMDLMASLEWVYRNIEAFGGDREKITVMGSSAGAKAIGAMMCLPQTKQWAHQVILSSGAAQSIRSRHTASVIARDYMAILKDVVKKHEGEEGIPFGKDISDKELLLTLPPDILLEAQKILCDNPGSTCMFGPVADGVVLPENCEPMVISGTLWEGRAIIGSSRHEQDLIKIINPNFLHDAPQIARWLFGKNGEIAAKDFEQLCEAQAKERGTDPSDGEKADIWTRILTDYMYRTYSYRLAGRLAKKGCKVWQFTVDFMPAYHCFDQQLAFSDPMPMFFSSKEHRQKAREVGQVIYKEYVNFIEMGVPADPLVWPCLDPEKPCQMIWDEVSGARLIPEGDVLDHIGEEVYIR